MVRERSLVLHTLEITSEELLDRIGDGECKEDTNHPIALNHLRLKAINVMLGGPEDRGDDEKKATFAVLLHQKNKKKEGGEDRRVLRRERPSRLFRLT